MLQVWEQIKDELLMMYECNRQEVMRMEPLQQYWL
jgi:hypothetical protein